MCAAKPIPPEVLAAKIAHENAMDKIRGLVNKVDLKYNSGIMKDDGVNIPPHERDPGAFNRPESCTESEYKIIKNEKRLSYKY